MNTITNRLSPLPLWKAVLLFVATSVPIYVGVHHFIPVLENRGYTFLSSYLICFYPTFAAMFLLAFILYSREGNSLSWDAFKSRYRLHPVKGRTWIWVACLFTFGLAASFGLSFTGRWLASFPFFSPPNFLPSEINPLKAAIPGTFMGTSVHGQWGYAAAYFLGWLFNILGEEFLWRGFVLPRQEVSYGRWAWLIHGVLWTGWHFFWKWNLISLIPITLGLSFVVQKTKNTTVAILVHGLANLIPLIGLVYYILT
ncbi:MAG: CPBP family intramembrane glutamic endopeptidase [Chloroflexota bacterium]